MSTKEGLSADEQLPDDEETREKVSLLSMACNKFGDTTIRPADFNQVDSILLHSFMAVGNYDRYGKWLKMDSAKIQHQQAGATPSSSSPTVEFLGAIGCSERTASTDTGGVPNDMKVYRNFDRPLKMLREPHSSATKRFLSEVAKDRFYKYFDGDGLIFCLNQELNNPDVCMLTVYDYDDATVTAATTDSATSTKISDVVTLDDGCKIDSSRFFQRVVVTRSGMLHEANTNDFEDLFTIEQHDAIKYRILHNFIRWYGVLIKPIYEDRFFGMVKEWYRSNEYWGELVDLRICQTDMNFNSIPPGNDLLRNCVKLGEALEARGKFLDAAHFL